jgi:hypothetical protein
MFAEQQASEGSRVDNEQSEASEPINRVERKATASELTFRTT